MSWKQDVVVDVPQDKGLGWGMVGEERIYQGEQDRLGVEEGTQGAERTVVSVESCRVIPWVWTEVRSGVEGRARLLV
jgi:hypothetical protein